MLFTIFTVLLCAFQAQAKAVFAHFMVTNTAEYVWDDFENDIKLAQEAHIDAFALNMAAGDDANTVVPLFFQAAESLGFKLFFSFDYAGNGAWEINDVLGYIKLFGSSPAYYQYNGQPFVSTFEGPANAKDWLLIKAETNCFFMPDYSSLGAKPAVQLGVADGLFSWAAWPWGNEDMNTYVDASYLQYLGDLPYMMPASPWFFTNLPGYTKNWLWRGDHLWYDRWQEILFVKPPFVEIISWNDYGESHYIGPLRDYAMDAFSIGLAPYNYATDMPHDGWRLFLPYLIDTYKNGIATITNEGLMVWHRLQPGRACATGNTTGNTASQLQIEFPPYEIVEDRIFYSALLSSPATVTVSIGGKSQQGTWQWEPDGGIGIYHGSVPFGSSVGDVVVTLSRSGSQIAQVKGSSITTSCKNGIENWNAWVGSDSASKTISATPKLALYEQKCINGTGANNFEGICNFACEYGYCPIGACLCQLQGKPKPTPKATGKMGYPLAGEDASYSGLCAFDCPLGYCPDNACGTTSAPLSTPTVSDFLPPACVAGTGEGNLEGLCNFACNYGYCPIAACKCTKQGALNPLPPKKNVIGHVAAGLDATIYGGLCAFTCEYGYCPEGACYAVNVTGSGSGPGSGIVYVDPVIFVTPSPVIGCFPPCTLIIPPSTMPSPTTIHFPTYHTTFSVGSSSFQYVVPSPVTTSVIDFFPVPIDPTQTNPFSFALTPSYSPLPLVISAGTATTTLYPPPVTAPSQTSSSTTAPVYISLGTTDYVTNGITQKFSEAQDIALRTLKTPTVLTTTIPGPTSGTTTPSPVVIWFQKGGFYWSPVPNPTPPPIRIPTLPKFPPIPSPKCFKLFDIFSIDCPPNKHLPTTTFESHKPEPTCTGKGCGKVCSHNCDTSTSSECSERTATDYWVTCSGTSCKTTMSATITGCSVTGTATTTGRYCPTGITLDPNEDQGQDGPAPSKTVMVTTSIPEVAIVSGTPVTVKGGSITIGGKPFAIPAVTGSETTMTIGGVPVVVVPGYTGTVPSYAYPTTLAPGTITSTFLTTVHPTTIVTTVTASIPPYPTKYNCKGSGLCGFYPHFGTYCKAAPKNIVDSEIYGTTHNDSNTGVCAGAGDTAKFGDGCGVFVKGTGCEITGAVLRKAADDLWNIERCGACGNVWLSNGCRVIVDFVSHCKSPSPDTMAPLSWNRTSSDILIGVVPNNYTISD
ncbi:glycosyl hydrolase family 71-domain-containing protein [Paecilomyces variotii]|uniref:Glycosyl hydrolase family 71-domain-containing protein n=1 Tax=Byssochlamys spectabilis TaxID=264951 RepID=A0A443HNK9_BYSSP|nr:glycosyl hydrolase family 71-domain-containing protein [Paecilomyces variotii]RWQ93422.1 glycosyl hydrolase family 71-domain-containing protein [Paecilomyces variotii]